MQDTRELVQLIIRTEKTGTRNFDLNLNFQCALNAMFNKSHFICYKIFFCNVYIIKRIAFHAQLDQLLKVELIFFLAFFSLRMLPDVQQDIVSKHETCLHELHFANFYSSLNRVRLCIFVRNRDLSDFKGKF